MHVLRTLALVLFSSIWALASPATAQQAASPEIEATISSQIDAFLKDDFVTAFDFASPNIQGLFGTPENFGRMVRNGYPMVWRPDDVRFGPLRDVAGGLWQRVIVQDAQGNIHALDYAMVQIDGMWKIAGVQLLPAPDVSA